MGNVGNKIIRDMYISVTIIILMIVRGIGLTADWMGSVACVGLMIALLDLYLDIEEQYKYFRKFFEVRGVFIITGLIILIIIILSIIKIIVIPPLLTDEISLLTLLVSLPKDLCCDIANRFICGEKDNE